MWVTADRTQCPIHFPVTPSLTLLNVTSRHVTSCAASVRCFCFPGRQLVQCRGCDGAGNPDKRPAHRGFQVRPGEGRASCSASKRRLLVTADRGQLQSVEKARQYQTLIPIRGWWSCGAMATILPPRMPTSASRTPSPSSRRRDTRVSRWPPSGTQKMGDSKKCLRKQA